MSLLIDEKILIAVDLVETIAPLIQSYADAQTADLKAEVITREKLMKQIYIEATSVYGMDADGRYSFSKGTLERLAEMVSRDEALGGQDANG